MKIPEFAVNRKVTTAMLAMILVVLGMLSFTRLGLDFFPDLEFPTVSVITTYSGVSSEDIENTITRPLEQVINSVSRVKKVTSQTSEGFSLIMVEFEWGPIWILQPRTSGTRSVCTAISFLKTPQIP